MPTHTVHNCSQILLNYILHTITRNLSTYPSLPTCQEEKKKPSSPCVHDTELLTVNLELTKGSSLITVITDILTKALTQDLWQNYNDKAPARGSHLTPVGAIARAPVVR